MLEKAYAKLRGSYLSLINGSYQDAMMDLTGCHTLSLNFKDPKINEMILSNKLWDLIKHYDS